MELKIFIDKKHREEIHIYAHENKKIIDEIKQLVDNEGVELIGYFQDESVRINLAEVYYFSVEDNKIYAVTENEKLKMKQRLYQLESRLPENFVKINQSCIANVRKIDRVKADVYGSLSVIFKNSDREYVSRRQIKTVKERLGL